MHKYLTGNTKLARIQHSACNKYVEMTIYDISENNNMICINVYIVLHQDQ